jgi:superfamily II DNA helicase RecQ
LEVSKTINIVSLSIRTKIDQALRHLFGPSGKFRSEKQEEGLYAIIEEKSPLFIILPTGAGKSLMFEIPALFEGAKSTIVIVPLVALAENLLQRCKDDRIDTIIYGRGTPRYAKIIIIITETAISSTCGQFIQDCFLDGELERLVFDECHMIVTEESYRPKLQELWRLSVPVQYVFMSATYPPSFAPIFQEKMLIKEPFIVRERNEKPKCSYEVMRYGGGILEIARIVKSIIDLCIDERKV